MYNVYNKDDIYYLLNVNTNNISLIGNKKDLISFLARKINTHGYEDSSRWSNEYFLGINMGNDLICNHIYEYSNEHYYPYEYYENKPYLFFDGYDRVIDVRIFNDEVCSYYRWKNKQKYKYSYNWKSRTRRKYHCGFRFKHKNPRTKNIKLLDSKIEYENELYGLNLNKISDSNNPYPIWWDDTSRRVFSNWKYQYKVNKQHNVHNGGKNDNNLRKIDYDFSDYEIDEMLREDFERNH